MRRCRVTVGWDFRMLSPASSLSHIRYQHNLTPRDSHHARQFGVSPTRTGRLILPCARELSPQSTRGRGTARLIITHPRNGAETALPTGTFLKIRVWRVAVLSMALLGL